ncbi:MAG: hypothetical protein QF393_14690 [Rhodospirillales bacterium]|jgi:hypothetical protein|nr:hypothetical protein [Rhodospirillales bacterium]MDP6646094.1 hypothetical protein [Rhodospirillales bacterium]|tara:strand:- start:352 stop:516 length:165 start_codon:yes stop_codon:yes gene_type:complete
MAVPEKTWIVVAQTDIIARKLLPGHFEVYEVETVVGEFDGTTGIIGWLEGNVNL